MRNKEFEDFLKAKKQAQSATIAIDWEKRKQEWLGQVRELYKLFEEALEEYRGRGEIEFQRVEMDIVEENVGAYKAEMMIIILAASESICLRPIGTNVVAAKGRVDLEGVRDTVPIVLVDSDLKRPGESISVRIVVAGESPRKKQAPAKKKVRWEWRFVLGPPYREFLPVTKDTVLKMVMKVSDGG